MNKIILVDGNNLLFRSYYATAYSGNMMKNSKGFPTNALFGFVNMINKIITEEKPTHIMVAFDKGKTFRHEKYADYKGGRGETPDELKMQFPVAKELLVALGIKYYEIDNYEADDIIGTFAEFCEHDPDFSATIISSDKDLIQLVSDETEIKLLKQKDYIRYNRESFKAEYGIEPVNMVDLKALMGDASDNIPGVKGIGEKTALKLLQEYKTLDNLYDHIEEITGKTVEKLMDGKDSAYKSYDLATIVRNVPMEINVNDVVYKGKDIDKLNSMYEDLEFYHFLKKEKEAPKTSEELKVTIIKDVKDIPKIDECAIYLEILGTNYHNSKVLGLGVYSKETAIYLPCEILKQQPEFLKDAIKSTYDLKKTYVALKKENVEIDNVNFDLLIAASLLDYNVKDDIAYLANGSGADINFYDNVYGKGAKLAEPAEDIIALETVKKAKFIYDSKEEFLNKITEENMLDLFNNIEMPLARTLGDMEYNGVYVDKNTLLEMGKEISSKMQLIEQDIYNYAGETFNIASPFQLGEILFEKLKLPFGKKNNRGYSTSIDILEKLKDLHPLVPAVIEYRMLSKLYTTYIEGLINSIHSDNKIHTIYTQVLTRTGRLSSIEPNLQNIPVRNEYGKLIRKAFVPSPNSVIVSADYSQIELRILAHMAKVQALIEAFNNGADIHTKTASDIFHIPKEEVTSRERRIAKAVNFGIIYGISGYGLSENVGITPSEAKKFINEYLETYPGIKDYMDNTIKEAHANGYVKTLFNRKRNIPELSNKNYMIRSSGERMALNTPIQGTSADIIKIAMIRVAEEFKKYNLQSKMILQVHDELIFDCLKSEQEQVESIIKNVMEHVCELSVPLKVDIESGINWYDAK